MEAFKNGFAPQDQSLIDCKLPGLSSVVAQLSNSREIWFAERLGIEAMSRDFGDPNLFLTLNNSPRETYDTRLLLHKLEHGSDAEFNPDYFERNTECFTELMGRYADYFRRQRRRRYHRHSRLHRHCSHCTKYLCFKINLREKL